MMTSASICPEECLAQTSDTCDIQYRPGSTQYTGKAFTGALKDHGVQISMDGKGRCMDNTFIERLWRSVKYEKIFLEEFETVPELLARLKEYFEFSNFERPHQSLAGKTPAEI